MNNGWIDDGSIKGKVQHNRCVSKQQGRNTKAQGMKIIYQYVYHVILFETPLKTSFLKALNISFR